MQAADALPVILVAAFVVPLLVAWRTRMIRVDARIEVPPPEPGEQRNRVGGVGRVEGSKSRDAHDRASPFAPGAVVTPEQATGSSLRPIRVVPTPPIEAEPVVESDAPRVAPLTLPQDGVGVRRVIPMAHDNDVHLPAPIRRRGSGFPGSVDRAVIALPDAIPAPVRVSLAHANDDDN